MTKLIKCFASTLSFLLLLTVSVAAEKRVALVIGNSAYTEVAALTNPENDANGMAEKLKGLGFQIVQGMDLNYQSLRLVVRDFVRELEGADTALFYYAGHGLQVNGENYIVPIDASLKTENDLAFEALPINFILQAMERNTETNLVFLDACRDNPLARNLARSMGTRSASVGRGLAQMGTGVGTFISFSTEPGNVAFDGKGKNSPYTAALLKHLGSPGENLAVSMIRVRREVIKETGGKQVPWERSSLTGEVVLGNDVPSATDGSQSDSNSDGSAPNLSLELSYWESIKDANEVSFFEAYLEQFPNGTFSNLAKLKIRLIEGRKAQEQETKKRREAELAAALEAERNAEADRLAAVETEREAQANRAQEAKAERLRLEKEAEMRRAEIEALRQEREAAEAARAQAIAEAEAARKAFEERLAKLEAARKQQAENWKPTAGDEPAETQEVEVATLAQPEDVPITRPKPQIDPKKDRELVRSIQKELNRVGCSAGKADGLWGRKTERAIKSFVRNGKVQLVSLDPSQDLLNSLKGKSSRICPLVCRRGFEEKSGKCVRKTKAASLPPKQQPTVQQKATTNRKVQERNTAKESSRKKTSSKCLSLRNSGYPEDHVLLKGC